MNPRSIAGTRDSEIAVGAWQPNYSFDNPKGDVHTFRIGLFCEHFNYFDEIFKHPSSIKCVRKIKDIIRKNWLIYTDKLLELVKYDMKDICAWGNMLPYPIEVRSDGSLKGLDDQENFPNYPAHATIKGATINSNLSQLITS